MDLTPSWRRDILVTAALLLAGLLAGALFHAAAWGLALALAVALGWHLRNLYRLDRWLRGRSRRFHPPESRGVWDELFQRIYRLQQRNRKRKRKLGNMLSRFQAATAAMPDASVVLRADDSIEWWNPAAERLLGLSHPRDIGQRIGNLVRHPDFVEYLARGDYREAVVFPSPVSLTTRLSARIAPYGNKRRLLVVGDVTRLEQLEQMRRDFVANLSHELRTPLTVLVGYLETLAEDPEAAGQWGTVLQAMREQGERMQHIVDDLLMLSRLETEPPSDDAGPVDMPAIIDRVVADARALSGDEGHRLEAEVERTLWLRGRASELHSLVANLVFNAVRYTPAGGEIRVRWGLEGEIPVLVVEDTGIGIASQHLPRLTERFYRVDVGRSRGRGGTGLGLAIVKHVLLRHEGRLQVDSTPGKGSRFRCDFPVTRAVAAGRQRLTEGR